MNNLTPATTPEIFNTSALVGFSDIRFDPEQADLIAEIGLDTTIFLALFTDTRRGSGDPAPSNDPDPRGWWGDELLGIQTGSRLWMVTERAKLTQGTINAVRDAMQEAIDRQLVGTKMISSATIDVTRTEDGVMWDITLIRNNAEDILFSYNQQWDGQNRKVIGR